MTYSEIKIKINEEVGFGSLFSITVLKGVVPFTFKEKWVKVRRNRFEVTRGKPTSIVGQRSASDFLTSFNLDYNSTGNLFETSLIGNEVTIKFKDPTCKIISFEAKNIILGNSFPITVKTEHTITNYEFVLLKLTAVELIPSSRPCTHLRVRVKANQVIKRVTRPTVINNNKTDFVEFDVLRSGQNINFICESEAGQRVSQRFDIPNRLVSQNLRTTVNNSPYGATVIVNLRNSFLLSFQYSIDGNNWQRSNIFSNLANGDYTLHVKDQYGCLLKKRLFIEALGVSNPEFFIPKSNSIRCVKRSEAGIKSDRRIDDNRFSYEDPVEIPYTEYHIYSKTDNEPIQYKTNYKNVSIKAITKNKQEITLYSERKTNNIGLKDSRDAFVFPLENGNTGIYFKTGLRYNFDTGQSIGDYELLGGLPEWGKIGTYIMVNNAWFEIKNVFPSDDKQAEILEIEASIVQSESIERVGVIYNRDTVNVYEFKTDMGLFLNDDYFVIAITASDPRFPTLEYVSERIKVLSDMSDFVEIKYSNDSNTDILFSTGIEFKIWMRIEHYKDNPATSINTIKTDTNAILVDGTIHQTKEFVFEPVTSGMLYILYQALSRRILFINGMPFVLSEPPEKVGDWGDTNLYSVQAKFYKNNGVFKSRTFDTDLPMTGGILELPPLIQIQPDGYIKI